VLTRCSGQLRLAPQGAGVIGLDLAAAIHLGRAAGYDEQALSELLPAGETGLVKALNERLAATLD